MATTIDQELVLYLQQRLREMSQENFPLEHVLSDLHRAIHDWLVEQQLDPETFSQEKQVQLILKAALQNMMTIN